MLQDKTVGRGGGEGASLQGNLHPAKHHGTGAVHGALAGSDVNWAAEPYLRPAQQIIAQLEARGPLLRTLVTTRRRPADNISDKSS